MRTGRSRVREPPIHHVEIFFGFLLMRALRTSDSDRNRANRVRVIRRDMGSRMLIRSPQKEVHDDSSDAKRPRTSDDDVLRVVVHCTAR
jgi:hypothetical protein